MCLDGMWLLVFVDIGGIVDNHCLNFRYLAQNFDTQESTMTTFLTCLHTFQHLNTMH